jgi:sigma-E factor negative regulatory protein RseA
MHKTRELESTLACELVSALADGELQNAELTQALHALQDSGEAQARWHAYHVVGEVMRSGAAAPVGPHDPAFVARLRGRLAASADRPQATEVRMPEDALRSANDAVWRWKLVAGLCALAVVAVLGWQLVALQRPDAGADAQLAAAQQSPVTTVQRATADGVVMIRDPQLDRLIAEHQQLGGTSALQMPAGFLRNATFERPAR